MKTRFVEGVAIEVDLEGLLRCVREEEEAGNSRVEIGNVGQRQGQACAGC